MPLPRGPVLFLLLLSASLLRAQQATTVRFQPVAHGLLTVQATIGGKQGTFLFDSGNGVEIISPAFAAAIACHPWGQITGFRMQGQRLSHNHCDHVPVDLAGNTFQADSLSVIDLAPLMPPDVPHLDGAIGLDLFAGRAFTLSYSGAWLRLLDKTSLLQATRGLRAVPIHIVRDAEGVALTVNLPVVTPAGTAWFEMDSGNTSSVVLVNKALAPLFSLPADGDAPAHLTLADGTTFDGEARVLDLILDGNLGTSFLSRHDVTVDLPAGSAWISLPTPDTEKPR